MLKKLTKKRNQKGFTLIELVVVIAILGILAAIAVPRFGQVQKNAKIDADTSTAEQIVSAAKIYITDKNLPDTGVSGVEIKNLTDAKLLESAPISQVKKDAPMVLTITNATATTDVVYTVTANNEQIIPNTTDNPATGDFVKP